MEANDLGMIWTFLASTMWLANKLGASVGGYEPRVSQILALEMAVGSTKCITLLITKVLQLNIFTRHISYFLYGICLSAEQCEVSEVGGQRPKCISALQNGLCIHMKPWYIGWSITMVSLNLWVLHFTMDHNIWDYLSEVNWQDISPMKYSNKSLELSKLRTKWRLVTIRKACVICRTIFVHMMDASSTETITLDINFHRAHNYLFIYLPSGFYPIKMQYALFVIGETITRLE
jgi:hypothetical protein